MDKLLKDLFGGDDEPTVAPAAAPAAPAPDATATAKPDDPDREARRAARREVRRQRKADPDRRRKRDDFVERYTTGDPSEGFTTEEAIAHLREMREELSPAEFRAAMQRTLENLPPSQRDDFVAVMSQYQAAKPAGRAAASAAPGARDATADPFGSLLTGLMGGGAGGIDAGAVLDDLQRGGTRAQAPASGQPTEADFRALLDSPLARAVLGGVAAYGMQGMRGGDDDDHDAPPSGTRAGT